MNATPSNIQSLRDSAAGPGYTVQLTPLVYPSLRFNHARPCTPVARPGAVVHAH